MKRTARIPTAGTVAAGRAAALLCAAALATAGCSSAPSSGTEPGAAPGAAVLDEGDSEDENRSTAARYDIPPGHLPPPGQCRIWVPGEPPGRQTGEHQAGRCSELRETVPENAWLVYRPTDDRKHVRVWRYGGEREVLFQRIYDIETGELVRHVAPASGD